MLSTTFIPKNLQFKWNGQTHWQIQFVKIGIIWNGKSS